MKRAFLWPSVELRLIAMANPIVNALNFVARLIGVVGGHAAISMLQGNKRNGE